MTASEISPIILQQTPSPQKVQAYLLRLVLLASQTVLANQTLLASQTVAVATTTVHPTTGDH